MLKMTMDTMVPLTLTTHYSVFRSDYIINHMEAAYPYIRYLYYKTKWL